jgi:hypothetical protein
LFQLRLHFVLKERIGIEEISAEQLLTIGLHRANEHLVTSQLSTSIAAALAAADDLPLRSVGCLSRNQHDCDKHALCRHQQA